jgi:linoleoyl-CoA desaturase
VTTRQRIDSYFKENGISKYANKVMWGKTIFFLGGFLISYLLILSNQFGLLAMTGLCVVVGAFCAFIGFNTCHDAIHGAFSEHRYINKCLSLLFNIIGANSYVWSITHNIVHHSFTNIAGHDEDIEIAPGLIRLSEEQEVHKIQCYQHLYAFMLYSLASLNWVFRKDYLKFFKKKIGQYPNTHHPRKEYFNLFFYKAVYYFLFIFLPLIALQIAWWQVVIGFLIMHLVQGLVSSLVFQITHIVEGTAFPVPNEYGNMEATWAEHQMRTSSNFAPQSALVNFFCGGLNFQTVHHLFPKICHIHYPVLAVIVKETAQEYNLPYIEHTSFLSALKSHYRILRKLGKEAYQMKSNKTTKTKRFFQVH